MSYQVIARKYRPQRFQDVVGQEHVTQTLSHAVEAKRIAHAYLFCGPRGTGKTTIARIFAKSLNCTGGPKADFDENDPRCKEIAEGRSLDVLEIDGASNNGVEQVRELRETCKYAPASSKYKIYIIDEVHMLSTAAFNALLKTLEEPPEHVKFMFATTDPEKVLPTILSRCQRFDLRRIPVALIAKHLTSIAVKEKVTIAPAALHAIARGAEGAMRDAESTLDQLISFCGVEITENDVLSMFGLTAQSQLLELARAVLGGEVEQALRQLNELSTHGKDLGRLLSDLLSHFRNLLIFQVSRGDLDLLEVSEAETGVLAEQSQMASADGLTRIMEVLADAEMRLRDATSKKILVEVALLKAIEARGAVSLDTVLKKLRALRDGETGEAAATAAPARARATASSPRAPQTEMVAETTLATPPAFRAEAETVLEASDPSAGRTEAKEVPSTLDALWDQLVEKVGAASKFIQAYLREAHPVSLTPTLLTIGFETQFEDHMVVVDDPRNHKLLQAGLAELGHAGCQVKFVKAAAAPGRPSRAETAPELVTTVTRPTPTIATARSAAATGVVAKEKTGPVPVPFSKDDFKNDPLIQKALEIFKGQIVEVRA